MCVTNTTHRRVQAVTLTPSQVGVCPSVLSQRLLGTLPTKQGLSLPSQAQPQQYVSSSLHAEKPRPKRRRKPQKPGKTAKMNDRHFVVHNYHDHAYDRDDGEQDYQDCESVAQHEEQHEMEETGGGGRRRRGGVSVAFPVKLHTVLEQVEVDGLSHVISWQPHGRCFVVHKPKEFVDHVMPK